MIKIDKNIPIPSKWRTAPKYPFKAMRVGDSFSISIKKVPQAHNRINVAMCRQHKTTSKRYTLRNVKSSNEIRVWRIS